MITGKEYVQDFELFKNPDEFMEIGEDIADGNNEYYYVLVQTFSMAAFDFTPFDAFFGGLSGNFTYEVDGINYTQQNSLYGLNFNIEVNPTNPDLEYHYGLFKTLAQTAEIEGVNLVDVNYRFKIPILKMKLTLVVLPVLATEQLTIAL
mgnify:CR=1 FL=1